VNVASKGFFWPPCITRFPPNFVRQSSIKARRNCSNIGVAQVVAASATDRNTPVAVAAAAAAALTSAPAEVVDGPLELAENGSAVVSAGVNETLIGSAISLPRGDAAEAEKPDRKKSSTLAVHGGERTRRPKVQDTLTIPICQTSTYTFKDTAELIAFQEGTFTSFEYGRYGNPTTNAVEEKISALEGAEATLLSASGMCAATTMLLALVPAGGHIVTTTDCYRRTRQFIQTLLPKMGITTTVIDPADIPALQLALEQNNVSIFFSESPTNPYLRCIDIELVSKLCHEHGALVCIDGTFATPVNQQALALGADFVLHSATKYLAGHNDVLAGSLSGSKQCLSAVRALHNILGGVVDPNAAYLILRGLKTLDLRVTQQNRTASLLASKLEAHPKVARVHYPGLESHPEHHIAKRQMSGFGGVISFEIEGDLETTSRFIDGLRIPYIAPSLGGVESLVEQPTIISYWDQSPAERARLGIKDNLVRFSCGIEDYQDIHNDVMQSLDAL
jgi:cystathionine gamma-synthase